MKFELRKKDLIVQNLSTRTENMNRLQTLYDEKELEAKKQISAMECKMTMMQNEHQKEISRLSSQLAQGLTREQGHNVQELIHRTQMLQKENTELMEQKKMVEDQVSQYKKRTYEAMRSQEEVLNLAKQVREGEEIIRNLTRQLEKQKQDNQTSPSKNQPSVNLQYQMLQMEVDKLRKANRVITQRDQNIQMYKEKVEELKALVASQAEKLANYNLMQAQYDGIMEEHKKLEESFGSLGGLKSPEEARRALKRLDETNEQLECEIVKFKQHLLSKDQALQQKEKQIADLSSRVTSLETQLSQALDSVSNQESLISILSKEKEHMKEVLDTYSEEEKVMSGTDKTLNYKSTSVRIQELERTNQEKFQFSQKLINDINLLTAQQKELEKTNLSLEKENERLGKDISVLQNRLGAGDYNPLTTKILHFVDNPARLAQQEFHEQKLLSLELENEKLKIKVTTLEEHFSEPGKDNIPVANFLHASLWENERKKYEEQLKVYREKLTAVEKSKRRFHEVFDRKFVEFKKAIKQIFGYRIELLGEKASIYRLYPHHTPNKDCFFLLEYDGHNDSIALLDSKYAALWQKELEYYLGECHSYPAFLAAITLANQKSARTLSG
eukprot:TRINITY_DN3741_c0_g2_i5.p1 TRINITY_DN3741_c0_g2~~TRINITY_DN3741_c0_g2_i5.p1  ORF type:complete len:613 (+),score=192.37 TRINITY_DN3741_c0_g2_i5:414-2252(+)